MASRCLWILLAATIFVKVKAEKGDGNKTALTGRTARYGYSENSIPPASLQDRFYDPAYPQFSDRRDRFSNNKPLPYEIPSSFDEFIPDKSSGPEDPYGSKFYFPYTLPDYPTAEVEEKNKVTTSTFVYNGFSLKDLVLKALRYFVGNNDPDSVLFDEKPSLLSTFKQLLKDPVVALTTIVVPLSFLLSTVIPFLTKMLMKSSIVPAVTSTIANTVARSLGGPEAEQMLDALKELGSRAISDPKCMQRMLCDAAKSQIESRNADSWSAQKIIRKLAKSVDSKLWEALGMRPFFSSLQNGRCENIPCGGGAVLFSGETSLNNKLQAAISELFNYTVTEVL